MSERTPIIVPPGSGATFGAAGSQHRLLITGKETEGRYAIALGEVSHGKGPPPHRHGFGEGFYILSGEVTFFAGNRKETLGRGGFIHIEPGVWHRFEGASREPARVLGIFAPAGFEEFLARAAPPGEAVEPQAVRALGAEYGIEFDPPAEAWQEEPNITIRRPGEGDYFAVVGDLYRFLAETGQTAGRYTLWHAVVSPGGGPPPHTHRREDEGFFVLAGEVEFLAEGRTAAAGPGTYLHLPIGSLHGFRNPRHAPAEMLIVVGPSGLEGLFRSVGVPITDPRAPIPEPAPDEIARLLRTAPRYGVEIRLPGNG